MIHHLTNEARFNIPVTGHPMHREVMWFANDNSTVLGIVILNLVDKDFSWLVLTEGDHGLGFTAVDLGTSHPSEDDATAALHDAM
jgi:hypothetical protein